MIENLEDVDAVIAWMQHPPPKPHLDAELAISLERWRQADAWMREFMSVRAVWPMLVTKYGYSESTARRDIEACQRLFGEFKVHKKAYYAGLMLDTLAESYLKAQNDRKWGECARLAKVILEYLGLIEETTNTDPKDLVRPVQRLVAFTPDQIGAIRDENLRMKIEMLKRRKEGAENATYTDVQPEH